MIPTKKIVCNRTVHHIVHLTCPFTGMESCICGIKASMKREIRCPFNLFVLSKMENVYWYQQITPLQLLLVHQHIHVILMSLNLVRVPNISMVQA
jgi:hypothetical protein